MYCHGLCVKLISQLSQNTVVLNVYIITSRHGSVKSLILEFRLRQKGSHASLGYRKTLCLKRASVYHGK